MRFAFILVVSAVSLFSFSALASEGTAESKDHYCVEISGRTNAFLRLTTGSDSKTTYSLSTEIAFPIVHPMLDAALDLEFASTNQTLTGERSTELSPVAGLQYNFVDPNPRDSFFLFYGVGIAYEKEGDTSHTKFAWRGRGGKRFSLSSSVSYAPNVSYTKVADADGRLDIVPLAFSLFL